MTENGSCWHKGQKRRHDLPIRSFMGSRWPICAPASRRPVTRERYDYGPVLFADARRFRYTIAASSLHGPFGFGSRMKNRQCPSSDRNPHGAAEPIAMRSLRSAVPAEASAICGGSRQSDECAISPARPSLSPARQQAFSADLVNSAVCIFEQRLGRPVSDGEARMLLSRLVDFVRLSRPG